MNDVLIGWVWLLLLQVLVDDGKVALVSASIVHGDAADLETRPRLERRRPRRSFGDVAVDLRLEESESCKNYKVHIKATFLNIHSRASNNMDLE